MAGGSGTRLFPITRGVSKHLLPIFDKPMIYYPLSTLMLAGIREFIFVVNPDDRLAYEQLLGGGSRLGLSISYIEQETAGGIAEGLILCADLIKDDPCALILGDNIFHGNELISSLKAAEQNQNVASLFTIPVSDPCRYGVMSFDDKGTPIGIEEKPKVPKSRLAVTGLYFYPAGVAALAKELEPSPRGELEITDLNNLLIERGQVRVERLGRGHAWIDAGTHEALLESAQFVATMQQRLGYKIAVPEEIAFRSGWLSQEALLAISQAMPETQYQAYLSEILLEQA